MLKAREFIRPCSHESVCIQSFLELSDPIEAKIGSSWREFTCIDVSYRDLGTMVGDDSEEFVIVSGFEIPKYQVELIHQNDGEKIGGEHTTKLGDYNGVGFLDVIADLEIERLTLQKESILGEHPEVSIKYLRQPPTKDISGGT